MRVGCDLPYFADPGATTAFAQGAEHLGYHHLSFSEHLASSSSTRYPGRFSTSDPWRETSTTLGFLAGVTSSIELTTGMHLVTLRQPVLVAKQMAEIALLSKDRLRLAVSVGWNREEQVALGVDPATRGRRLDEMIPLLRRLWTEEAVDHKGEFFTLEGVGIHPRPQSPIPIWIGSGGIETGGVPNERSVLRCARLADGYTYMGAPTGTVDSTLSVAERLHQAAAKLGRKIGVEARIVTMTTPADQWGPAMRRYRESGLFSHVGFRSRVIGGPPEAQVALLKEIVERTGDEW